MLQANLKRFIPRRFAPNLILNSGAGVAECYKQPLPVSYRAGVSASGCESGVGWSGDGRGLAKQAFEMKMERPPPPAPPWVITWAEQAGMLLSGIAV